jgi:hypothetical protein
MGRIHQKSSNAFSFHKKIRKWFRSSES